MKYYERYKDSSFDNYICETNAQKELVEILRKPKEIKNNIIIIGSVGTGKTHLAYAVLNAIAEKKELSNGKKYYASDFVKYTTIKQIVDDIRKLWGVNADNFDREAVNQYKEVPLIIIDEIGVQYGSESERIELYEIFNERYNEMLPTIAISNLRREGVEKILGRRITDRLFGGAKIFEIEGKSKR